MPRSSLVLAAISAVVLAGCGTQASSDGLGSHGSAPPAGSSPTGLPAAHPQAVDPAAGVQATPVAPATATIVSDNSAHAEPLSLIRTELKALNLCGGETSATVGPGPLKHAAPGFLADPGTSQTEGQLPEITADLAALGKALGVTIYGISGYRTPAQSVAVGGYADDPHTRGMAEDIGVNSLVRSSAAAITEAELAKFDLYRPFDPADDPDNTEVNHLQLIPTGGPLTLAEATAEYQPDPQCK